MLVKVLDFVFVCWGSGRDSYSSSLLRPQQWFHSPVRFATPDSSYQQSIALYPTPPPLLNKHNSLEVQTSVSKTTCSALSYSIYCNISQYLCGIYGAVFLCSLAFIEIIGQFSKKCFVS